MSRYLRSLLTGLVLLLTGFVLVVIGLGLGLASITLGPLGMIDYTNDNSIVFNPWWDNNG